MNQTYRFKICGACEVELPTAEFYAHPRTSDGLLGICKACHKKRVRQNRAKKRAYYNEYDRNRYYVGGYRYKDGGNRAPVEVKDPEYHTQKTRKSREKNPLSYKARTAVSNALRQGKLVRPGSCARCGEMCKPHAHHHDYSRPLDVEWICTKCHGLEHRIYP